MRSISKTIVSVAATTLIVALAFAVVACGQESEPAQAPKSAAPGTSDVSSTMPEDVAVSDLPAAPDFTLPAANRDSTEISLSSFQGDKEVVLVFYRAYW